MRPRGAGRLLVAALLVAGSLVSLSGAPAAHGPAATSEAAPDTAIPRAAGFVNDVAGVMDEPSRAKLEAFLDQLRAKTTVQFAVLTVPTTAPLEPSEYKVRVFERWRIGETGKDNGLLMLVAIAEHEVRFETGYGLEGTLPDGFQSRVVRNVMAPLLRAGDYSGGITQGVLACSARIAAEQGVTLEWDGRELRYSSPSDGGGAAAFPIALFVFVLVVLILVGMAGRRGFGGYGGGYGGWGGWGGGFGGGSFGGGGFGGGGGSFGGFGGGSSGGGGGGGKW